MALGDILTSKHDMDAFVIGRDYWYGFCEDIFYCMGIDKMRNPDTRLELGSGVSLMMASHVGTLYVCDFENNLHIVRGNKRVFKHTFWGDICDFDYGEDHNLYLLIGGQELVILGGDDGKILGTALFHGRDASDSRIPTISSIRVGPGRENPIIYAVLDDKIVGVFRQRWDYSVPERMMGNLNRG